MKIITQSPKKALKAYIKQKPLRSEIDGFKANLIALLGKISLIEKRPKDESEEHLKNDVRDFLRDTYYKNTNAINTKDKKDLVIHLGKTTDSEAGVIIEAKRPSNINEMLTEDNPVKKALFELILYYFDERIQAGNNKLKHLVITNIQEWYIIDANYFDKLIYRNSQIKKLYETKLNDNKDNPFFYEEIAKIIAKLDIELPFVYFDIRDYETFLRNDNKEDDKELIALYKILSPQFLLKIEEANDSNSLNGKFYIELLHIIGLEEDKVEGKKVIRRKKKNPNPGSLIELTIEALITEDPFSRIPDPSIYGETNYDRLFNISLELCITWINRILFLKLLEGQLITYHQGNTDYRFLNHEVINDFDELFKLFHKVLAVNYNERNEAVKIKYNKIPYLNSSLFEFSDLEERLIKINSLDNSVKLELINTTILKNIGKRTNKLPLLEYLFNFLDAYDFASEGSEDIQEDNKTIINASVLGKVFEKINGYKDGSIFTPAFITMFMCNHSIRLAVVEKFNQFLSGNNSRMFDKFEDVKNYTSRLFKTQDILKANDIINSLRICDPAVGSGHFLVSSLNELISIKAELGILADKEGNTINGYEFAVINDELIITDNHGNNSDYRLLNGKPITKEMQRLQKTLFFEKQTLIENCLFGVDINPNSVKICRLRLWIELLKNAFYKEDTSYSELETLPNIDINIKCGNSLISRFSLKDDVFGRIPNFRKQLDDYKFWVREYKNVKDRIAKKKLTDNIRLFTDDFKSKDPKLVELQKDLVKLSNEYYTKFESEKLFNESNDQKLVKAKEKLKLQIADLKYKLEELNSNKIYQNAFEWRFEFPEVLNQNGDFEGFDVVISNPPYIRHEELSEIKDYLKNKYCVFTSGGDIFSYFYEVSNNILQLSGLLSFINNTFDKTTAGKVLREYTSKHFRFLKYIDFTGVVVFEEATTYPVILIAQKSKDTGLFKYFKFDKATFTNKNTIYDETTYTAIDQNSLNHSAWNFLNSSEFNIITKISKHKALIDIYGKCYRGIITGLNEAFVTDKVLGTSALLKHVYDGKDLKKWSTPAPFKKMIVIESKSTKMQFGDLDENTAFEGMHKKEPKIMDHLSQFTLSAKKRYDKGDYWWELRNCAYYDLFARPKIIFPNLQNTNKFAFEENGVYINAPAVFLPSNDKYLLALLNSKVVWHFLKSICVIRSGGYIEVKPQYFEQIPIPLISEKEKKPFIALVDKILLAKSKNKDISDLETKIDELVYKLYDITPEEQKIIEGK